MAKRMVICVECGRRFDAEEEGAVYDPSSRRYTCRDCEKKNEECRKQRMIENAGRPDLSGVKKQKTGAMIAKFAVGALFICVGLFGGDMEFGARMVGLILGIALIAWGVWPILQKKKAVEEAKQRRQAEIDRQAAEAEALRNQPWTCPACGAKTKGDACEYCGEMKP